MRELIITALALLILGSAFAGSGAIAYSKPDDVLGLSYGSGSQADAERWALLDCRDKGGADCQFKVVENNACAAIAAARAWEGVVASPFSGTGRGAVKAGCHHQMQLNWRRGLQGARLALPLTTITNQSAPADPTSRQPT
jgi:hypothetical protein